MSQQPSVLFVCVRNGGKSQMAAGLMRQAGGDTVDVDSARTTPGDTLNALPPRPCWKPASTSPTNTRNSSPPR